MSPVAQAAEIATKAATDEHPIGYLPGLFAQHCIFPQKRLPSGQHRWTIHTHKKRIELQSGTYLLPGLAEQGLGIPYGITPRLILPYIARQALYGRRKVILGKKLLHFVRKLGLTPCSKSYRTVLRQVVNLATCQIVVSNMSTDSLAVRVETDIYNVTSKLRL